MGEGVGLTEFAIMGVRETVHKMIVDQVSNREEHNVFCCCVDSKQRGT